MVNRSWLYVPGDAPDKLDGALGRGADAVIVDLEDSVAASAKDQARATTVDWLTQRPGDDPTEVWVRVNANDRWRNDDLAAVASVPITGVVVPKASASLLTDVRSTLADHDSAARIAGLVEDARALAHVTDLAVTPGLSHLGIGEADLRADLNLDPSDDERELQPLRMAVVVASAAAGIQPPVGATSTDYTDLEGLRASTERLRRLGFGGRTAIHPRQVPVINDVFTPTTEQVAEARDLLVRLGDATADGSGVVTDARGRMVDEAVARRARHVIALAEAAGRRG